ncbi:MAG: hypothetical protein IPH44_42610 [Myxococcales bacterium]|jgi:hypothetical protein|nr:hypothetical protein [Myxococcales bacterium]MBK7192911.1 hypothetical protein [Myxococcales bacterium]MBP6847370.1 hypothetical protein [Kofleriaceae bacterium]
MADQRATAAPREATGIYADFDAFKKQAIRDYYERGWTSRRGNFIALLIAAGGGASLGLAKDSVVDGTGTKKVAIGAGLALALRVGLRYALGGPLSLVLTAAAGASMLAYLVRNQKDILKKVERYRGVLAETERKYKDTHAQWRDGKYDVAQRNLMIDGLMKRFVADVDEA